MNWLGAGLGASLVALLGSLLGAVVHFFARRHGLDFPPLVGVLAGIAAALVSHERNGLRGLLVASLSVWATAVAEVLVAPADGVLVDVLHFHDRLGIVGMLAYAGCAACGGYLGSRGFRGGRVSEVRS